MEVDVVTQPRRTAAKSVKPDPQAIADKILNDLRGRFTKLNRAEGELNDKGDFVFRVGHYLAGKEKWKHSCEAAFKPDENYQRIYRNFQGWAEAFALKLGVVKLYENIADED